VAAHIRNDLLHKSLEALNAIVVAIKTRFKAQVFRSSFARLLLNPLCLVLSRFFRHDYVPFSRFPLGLDLVKVLNLFPG
jgi:hypothetical protein